MSDIGSLDEQGVRNILEMKTVPRPIFERKIQLGTREGSFQLYLSHAK